MCTGIRWSNNRSGKPGTIVSQWQKSVGVSAVSHVSAVSDVSAVSSVSAVSLSKIDTLEKLTQ
ncbi:MAG: hypothetical protein JWR02_3102 [Mucilaginibacter sp.]|nr:hypothetical protein [Mucilaginibacter sp.]